MLDMYDFNDDIWLCHSLRGQCFNFTAFVKNWSSHLLLYLDPKLETLFVSLISNLQLTHWGKLRRSWLRTQQRLSPSSLRTMCTGLKAYQLCLQTLVWTSTGFPFPKCLKGVKTGLLWLTWCKRITGSWFSLLLLLKKMKKALRISGDTLSKTNVSINLKVQLFFILWVTFLLLLSYKAGDPGVKRGSCPNRKESQPLNSKSSSLFLMNYFPTFPVEKDACKEHSAPLAEMVGTCLKSAGNRMPNFLAVNFYMVTESIVKTRIYYIFWRVLLNKTIAEKRRRRCFRSSRQNEWTCYLRLWNSCCLPGNK